MIHLAAAVFASLATAAPAQAAPPVPEVAVLVLAPWGGEVEFAGRMLDRVAPADGSGLLLRTPPAVSTEDFEACASSEAEACVRRVLAERGAAAIDGPPTVVVLISPAPGFLTGWTCIGVGEAASRADRQRTGLDWSPPQTEASVGKAADCILAAASESGW